MKLKQTYHTAKENRFIKYLFVGGGTFAIQVGLSWLLEGGLNINRDLATFLAYWTSVVYNFVLNRWWTFSAAEAASLHKHALAYAVLLVINYGAIQIITHYVLDNVSLGLAFAIAAPVQMTWNYFAYKHYIFGDRSLRSDVRRLLSSK